MRKIFRLLLIISFLCICLAGQISQETGKGALVAKARYLVGALSANNFKGAIRDFDAAMLKVAGPEKMAEAWKMVTGKLGAFKKQGDARKEQQAPYDIVFITCEFEKEMLDIRVTFDKEKHIAGFHFVPTQLGSYQPPAYSSPGLFEEKDVIVGSGDWLLPGTLTIPKGNGPFPALVLVHGSGANDRDETLGSNKPFKDLAWGLASRGIAVLRYEKRTRVYGAKLKGDQEFANSFTVGDETIEDALAAVILLKTENAIDPKKIFVLGHSLGGMLIPRIAAEGKNLDIAGFIIMAGATRKFEDMFLEQTNYVATLDGSLSEDEKKQIAEIEKSVKKIKALKKSDLQSQETILMAPVSYWLDLNEYDPVKVVKDIRQPILVLQGARDYQVATEDFENWKKALSPSTGENTDFKLYPMLNHLFFEGKGKSTPDEYMKIRENIAEYVINDIAGWLKKSSEPVIKSVK
ncbi:MAG: alpha/beta fold hydrolase [Candidatus Aminicenantes bacterium]|nr:alpha/beta fold hydrolase [Candidatus Aminicenantes bacterium]